MLYAEHPVGLREQAAAAAAAADAARQYLAHLRADERYLGAEDGRAAVNECKYPLILEIY